MWAWTGKAKPAPELWERWANGANLMLLARIAAAGAARDRLGGLPDVVPVLDAFEAAMDSRHRH